MKILDKIKRFFNRNKTQLLPEAQEVHKTNESTFYKVTREDGTELKICPTLDRLGNQIYQQVFNNRTNQLQCIPKFNIYAAEIPELLNNDSTLSTSVLIDMDPNLLQYQECLQWIANNMLNRERMPKVLHQYNGYAGILSVDSNFNCGKMIDEGIVKSLSQTREQNAKRIREELENRDREEKNRIYEYSKNISCDYERNPETVLPPECPYGNR